LSWSFLGPVYAVFLLSRGLDFLEINLVLATYLITAFLFEVPTGAVADLFGRKVSFLASCVVRMIAFALYAFSDSFHEFIFAEFIDAIGTTLASGALDAWAVDGVKAEGREGPVDRLFARAHVIARVLMITSGLASGYLAGERLVLPWFAGAGAFAVTFIVAACVMREPEVQRPGADRSWTAAHESLQRTIAEGLRIVRSSPVLLGLCLLTAALSYGGMPAHMLWQPRIQELSGEGTWLLGWVWAFINVSGIVGSALAWRLHGRVRRALILCFTAAWRGVTLGIAAVATDLSIVLPGVLMQDLCFGVSEPLFQAWMNEPISAERRATVLSVRSMFFTLGGGAGLVCIGLVARAYGISTAWLVSAAVFTLCAPGFLLLGRGSPSATPRPVLPRPEEAAAPTPL
jgi:MFS family permease